VAPRGLDPPPDRAEETDGSLGRSGLTSGGEIAGRSGGISEAGGPAPRRAALPNPKDFLAQDPAIPPPEAPEILALRQLPLVGATRAQLFWKLGCRSLADIAALDEHAFQSHPIVQLYPDGSILDSFPLIQGFARAIAEQRAIVVAPEPLFERLRGPFVFFDLEFVAGQGEVFLWGLKHGADDRVEQWFAHTRQGQRDAVERFRDLVLQEDPLFVAYGSTASDEVSIREAARRFGLDGAWMRQMRFLDLLQRVVFTESPETQRVYLPVRNLRCGVVAEFFGYEKPRSVDIKDGYQAFRLYQRYKRRPDPTVRDRLMRYNAEDLHQTQCIFQGMQRLFAAHR
jgi:predicted RecB family nuclease